MRKIAGGLTTGKPARNDDYSTLPGPPRAVIREDQMTSTVSVVDRSRF
jgi:hypothetical protein